MGNGRGARLDESRGALTPLTEAELAVLQLIADGLVTKEIAVRRGRSCKTIESQRHSILSKLKVGNQAAAVAWGFRNGKVI